MSKLKKWVAATLAVVLTGGVVGYGISAASEGGKPPGEVGPMKRAYWRALGIRSGRMQMRTLDALTQKPIPGAGCIIGETRQRIETDEKTGIGPMMEVPVFRHPRLEELLAEIHGALTIMCYKDGYRDAITMGVRTYPNTVATPEIWMYPVGEGDRRVEPTVFQYEPHRVWQIQLVDKYRLREEGEGPERPELSRPDTGQVAPQNAMGGGVQTPFRQEPPPPTGAPR